jgi:DNA-binding Lrp family transcriptional regulator
MKLDVKDRKILYHLDLNSRQSYSAIGKKVGLHRANVINRVNKMIDEKIIYRLYTLIDITKIGYTYHRFYIVLQNMTPNVKKNMIQDFIQSKLVSGASFTEGQIDLLIYYAVNNTYKLLQEWTSFYRKYGNYFSKISYSQFCHEYMYPFSFLLSDEHKKRPDCDQEVIWGGTSQKNIDELDKRILYMLSTNSRIPASEIAKELNAKAATIIKRIKNLEKNKIILGYRIDINHSAILNNYYRIRLDINIKNFSNINQINKYMIQKSLIRSRYISLGDCADLEYEILVKDTYHLNKIVEEILTKFPDSVRNYSYHRGVKNVKLSLFPDYYQKD